MWVWFNYVTSCLRPVAEKLWVMGGTPLNNEVWVLVNVTKVDRIAPLTRSM
jgi:hypothetical protein